MLDDHEVSGIGMVCIAVLAMVALATGHDGVILSASMAAIAGLAGYHYGKSV